MNDSNESRPSGRQGIGRLERADLLLIVWIGIAVLAVVAATIAWAIAQGAAAADRTAAGTAGSPTPGADDRDSTQSSEGTCPDTTTDVSTAHELQAALRDARAGDVIALAPGRYSGNFVIAVDGAPEHPITLCGTADSVLDGGDTDDGYVVHLDGASNWVLQGFAVQNGQKGVMADATTQSIIRGLTVSRIGDEAIHLRKLSTDNQVLDNTISDTGLRKPKFGEGIYIGTAESNWCDITDCEPDTSDRNVIEGNTISKTTSESVDVKEGTTGGVLRDNSFDGSAIVEADSWVDVKGNGWLIEDNTGTASPADGFQTHEILDGWGTDNVFRNNAADLDGSGLGFAVKPERDNVVSCSNTVTGGEAELSNVDCRD
jgi:hypothetical protein